MKSGYRKGVIFSNTEIANNIYEMKVKFTEGSNGCECHLEKDGVSFIYEKSCKLGAPGQFYMLKSWDLDPFLSRPISIANIEEDKLVFCMK